MNGYSKIRHGSLDLTSEPNPSFSPIRSAPQNPNLFSSKSENWRCHAADNLRRSRSSTSQRSGEEAQSLFSLQAAVTRAFSMRRNSAIGDGYWRIHDGGEGFLGEEEEEQGKQGRWRRKKGLRRKGFIGICRKFVGF